MRTLTSMNKNERDVRSWSYDRSIADFVDAKSCTLFKSPAELTDCAVFFSSCASDGFYKS